MDWESALVLAGVLAFVTLIRHLGYRRRLLLDVRLRNFPMPARIPQGRPTHAAPQPTLVEAVVPEPATPRFPSPPVRVLPERAVFYVDASGRCTLADDGTRALLQWHTGELCLADVVAGGVSEAATLLATLAHQGAIEAHATRLRVAQDTEVELSAVAVRDRDDNVWGAAVFLRCPASAPRPARIAREGV